MKMSCSKLVRVVLWSLAVACITPPLLLYGKPVRTMHADHSQQAGV